jgi:small-conductance mechanosensitive channel
MKMKKQKLNWIIDAALFAAFIICFLLDWTGLIAHQLLGIAIGALCVYHLILHWTWIKSVTARLFKRTPRQARNFYILDITMTLGLLTMLITGLFITPWFELFPQHYTVFKNIHVISAVLTLLLVILKIVLHWRWIVNTARRHIFTRGTIGVKELCPQPVPVSYDADKRNFIKLMGIAGLLSAVAVGGSLDGIKNALISQSSSAPSSAGTSTQDLSTEVPTTKSDTSSGSTTKPCIVQCDERCSYPGRCRRYRDTNGNGRCDLGECM